MGNRLGLSRSGAAVDESAQQAFIEEDGPARQIEMRNPRPATQATNGFATLASLAIENGADPERPDTSRPWWHLANSCPDLTRYFPNFRWRSVLGVIVCAQLLLYFVSCWVVTPRTVIQPSSLALWKIGSSDRNAERCTRIMGGWMWLELRRLVVPIFLHNGVMHIFLNLFFELSSGSRSLDEYGVLAFSILFFVSGVCGNLLSDANGVNGVGASTSCYGLIGAELAKVSLAWPSQGEEWRGPVRLWAIQTIGMLVIWELINWKTIDHYGHGGGLLGGFAVAYLVAHPSNFQNSQDVVRYKGAAGAALLVGVSYCVGTIFFWGEFWSKCNSHQVPCQNLCLAMMQSYGFSKAGGPAETHRGG